MFAIIINKFQWEKINNLLSEREEQILFKAVGDLDIDIVEEMEKISRINVNTIIIDIKALLDIKELPNVIKKYKLRYENKRIIILAPNIKPGHEVMAKLFALGVYDIINPDGDYKSINYTELLNNVLDNPTKFRQAIKWQNENINDNNTEKVKTKVIKKEVEKTVIKIKDRIIGTVIIGVAAATRGIGCTHTCINLASYITSKGYDVAILEMNNNNHFNLINNEDYPIGELKNSFCINGIDFYSNNSHNLIELINAGYKYIILDLGVLKYLDDKNNVVNNEMYSEYLRADKKILIGGIQEWQLNSLSMYLKEDDSLNWDILINYSNGNMFKYFNKKVKRNLYKLPFNAEPFMLNEELNILYEKLLENIMTSEKAKKKRKFSFFKN